MKEHAVVIAGGGPTGLMLAAELALARVDVAIVEPRMSQELAGSRAGGLHSRTIEVLDQRGIAEWFLSQGKVRQVAGLAGIPLDIGDFPTRHNYGLALWQNRFEQILGSWVAELAVPIHRGYLIAEGEMKGEPAFGIRRGDKGVNGLGKLDDGRVRVVLIEQNIDQGTEPTLKALHETMSQLLALDEARKLYGAMMSGLDIHYDLGNGHPLLGRRIPDLDLNTETGPRRVFGLLHEARPVLLKLDEGRDLDITPWADRVRLIEAMYSGAWELPVIGAVAAPSAVLIRPDGHVAWVGEGTDQGLRDALSKWFGPARR